MNKVTLQDNHGATWRRVSKVAARKAYNSGQEVTACPVKLHPFGAWTPGLTRRGGGEFSDFDLFCNGFTWHNCNNEAGQYVAFYLKEGA